MNPDTEPQQKPQEEEQPLEDRRRKEYEDNRGLFLGHYWEPSVKEGQKADIRVHLLAHRHPDGRKTPLEEDLVERVGSVRVSV